MSVSEFSAHQARKILEDDQLLNYHWYLKFSDQVFDEIISATKNGINQITIESYLWENSESKRGYLFKRLDMLGYALEVKDNVMSVKW